jgi:uncharacterized protein
MTTTLAPVYAPTTCIFLYISLDCPLRCEYCFVAKEPRRMTKETARKAVDFFLSRNISGVERSLDINFFGGEPFLEPDTILEVIRYTRQARPSISKQVRFFATTSGLIATPAVEQAIREGSIHLLVSLDGTPQGNAPRRLVSGRPSYPVVAQNLPKFMEWAPSVTLRATFHPQALDLVGNVRHLMDLGVTSIALCPVVEADWSESVPALEAAYEALADWYIEEARAGYYVPLELTRQVLQMWHRHLSGPGSRPSRPCGVGTWILGIDPEGHVMPCHRFLYRPHDHLGTVENTQLSPERWKYVHLSARDILGCDTCPAQPVCGGGCRLLALEAGSGLHGTHPGHCLTLRAHARAARRIYDTLRAEKNPVLAAVLSAASFLHPALTEIGT